MKFSLFSLLALGAASVVSATEVDLNKPEDSVQGEYLDPKSQSFDFGITYSIIGQDDSADVIELYNGEETVLNYYFENREEEDVTVVGVSGSFRDPTNGEILANITDAKVGPILIPAGESKTFQQRIGINLPSKSYLLLPGIYVVKGTALSLLGAKTKLVLIDERPLSIFSPQLVVLELLLLLTLTFGGYFMWTNVGADYLKTVNKTPKVEVRKSSPSTATTTGKKTVDESWLPAGHIKKTSNKRKTK